MSLLLPSSRKSKNSYKNHGRNRAEVLEADRSRGKHFSRHFMLQNNKAFVQLQLKSSPVYSSVMCEVCKKQLDEAAEIHRKFETNQKRLYDYVKEQEVCCKKETEWSDQDETNCFTDLVEDSTDPFERLDINPEEVLVKVECFDDDSCVKQTKAPEGAWKPPTKINLQRKRLCKKCGVLLETEDEYKIHLNSHKREKSQQEVPLEYKNCPICKKTLRTNKGFERHVSLKFLCKTI